MQAHRTDGDTFTSTLRPSSPPHRGTVQGLGVTDALRVELEPCQLDACLTAIDEYRRTLERALVDEWDRWAALPNELRGIQAAAAGPLEDEMDDRGYDLRVLNAMRTQLVESLATPVLCGPSRIVSQVVAGAACNAVEAFSGLMLGERQDGREARAELLRALTVAGAWVKTHVDSQEVQSFSFDADFDDSRP
jgi:hypothetical protein